MTRTQCIGLLAADRCTGCEACIQACPANALKMLRNGEGFYYPELDAGLCFNCGVCGSVCPEVSAPKRFPLSTESMAAIHRSRSIVNSSSSGGAFSAIVSLMGPECIVFGAAYASDLSVVHQGHPRSVAYEKFRGSKYVQSRIGSSYALVQEHLSNGTPILFTGTPCQIAGLRSYLGRHYDNLVCVEVVCHGVGSPGVFADYLQEYGMMKRSRPVSISFRHKRWPLGGWADFLTTVKFEDGHSRSTRFDLYMQGYLLRLFVRQSCLDCPYASEQRVSDIVIGDCWGIRDIMPRIADSNGVSFVSPITKKGADLCLRLPSMMSVKSVGTELAVPHNPCLVHPLGPVSLRDSFFEAYKEKGAWAALSAYVPVPSKTRRLASYLPSSVKRLIRRLS